MPTYDYVCGACGHALEIFHSMSEAPKKKCPKCGKSKLERRIGAGAGFLFKGDGFYKTDYRSDSYKASEKAEKTPTAEAATPSAGEKVAEKAAEKPKSETAAPKADTQPKKSGKKGE